MSTDLGFIVNAAQRDTGELAPQGARHRLAERGLADAGRSDQGDDRARSPTTDHLEATGIAPLAHGEKLDDPVLDVLQPGVVLVQHAAGLHHVELVDGALVPGHVEHPIQVIPDPAGLGVLLAGALEPVELTLNFLADGFRHAGIFNFLAILGGDVAVGLTKFFLNGFHLLAQQELALPLFHPLLHLVADLVLERGVGEDLARPGDQLAQPSFDVEGFQDLDLPLERKIGGITGQVRELAGAIDATDHLYDLPRTTQLEQVLDERLVLAGEHVRGLAQRVDVGGRLRHNAQGRSGAGGGTPDRSAVLPLQDGHFDAIGQFARILDPGDRANAGIAPFDSGNEQDETVALARGGDGSLRLLALQRDRDHHVRQHYPVVERKEGDEFSF